MPPPFPQWFSHPARDSTRLLARGVLCEVRFQQLANLVLLAAWQPLHLFEHPPHAASGNVGPLRRRVAEQVLNRNAERLGNRRKHVGARQRAGALPKADVGRRLVDLAGQFAEREAR